MDPHFPSIKALAWCQFGSETSCYCLRTREGNNLTHVCLFVHREYHGQAPVPDKGIPNSFLMGVPHPGPNGGGGGNPCQD